MTFECKGPAPKIEQVNLIHAKFSDFSLAENYGFRPINENILKNQAVRLGATNGVSLNPNKEYVNPMATKTLKTPPFFAGAIQSNK